MNLINKLTLKSSLAATAACIAAMSFSTANACTGVLNSNTNAVGTHNGFYYSFWRQTSGSRVNITCGEPGYYKTDWSGVFNWVGGMGWNPGGARIVNYRGTFNSGRQRSSSNSYLALYGWTRVPTEVEYYVVESYGTYNPANCGGGGGVAGGGGGGDGPKGSVTIGGVQYDLTQCTRTNQPSISGTSTFKQFFSVRNPPKPWGSIQGTITVQNHFDAWAAAGMQLGNDFDYMVLASEGYDGGNNSSGNSNLTISEGAGGGGGGGGNAGGGGGNAGGGAGGGNGGVTGGGSTGTGSNTIVVRAVGTSGSEQLRVNAGGSTIATLSLSTSWQDFTVNTDATGDLNVELFNDQGEGYEARVEYVMVNGDTRYAEDQSYNTSAWDGECGGGSNTQWMHCAGMIGFGDIAGSGGGSSGGNGGGGGANPAPAPTPTPAPGNGGDASTGSNTIIVRAVGTSGSEQLRVNVGGSAVETLSLSTNWQEFTVNTDASGDINVELFNDQGEGYEARVEYVMVNGDTRYASEQSNNTSAWDGECGGGSNTEWMHCNGMISFGDISGNGGSTGGGDTVQNTGGNGGNTGGNGGNTGGASGGTCNWYGSSYPMCTSTSSGWGWENNQSCISSSTCSSQ